MTWWEALIIFALGGCGGLFTAALCRVASNATDNTQNEVEEEESDE